MKKFKLQGRSLLTRTQMVLASLILISFSALFLGFLTSDSPGNLSQRLKHLTNLQTFKVITWQTLIPSSWDPLKQYRQMDSRMLIDSDPQVIQMMKDLREAWDNAPTQSELDGAGIKIAGYLVPLDESKDGLKSFLLVPYFGACIHSPPPPANQIIHVQVRKPVSGFRTMDTVWVSGVLSTQRQNSDMGMSGYRLDAALVERYEPPVR